ncbi:NUDIX domain-containing protein [Alteraurantiacibacter aestuarii]|uniref:NUDIX domain-containing protein n=1 Tax=Alteraurantiacibacter aestuarii TaxID=650004 RepID=A0A844ZJQ1_9SPHN|nr:NUDIX domain-containing protein [Alteraurantiacibacter aestuarii]MXO87502.1 NUDIX domain-containing protein [Alteraurantiacibacter aestuarii]
MLHLITPLIPPPLHRTGYRMAFALRTRWLRWRGGEIHGCTMIARDEQGRVLLVRHSYGAAVWSFPGGGMRKGEDPQLAALREFAEELGAAIADPQHLGTLTEDYHGGRNVAHIFTGRIAGEARPDMREIVEARFFHHHELPQDISRTVTVRMQLLSQWEAR